MEGFHNVSQFIINLVLVVLALWVLCSGCTPASTNNDNWAPWAYKKRHVYVTNDLFEGTPLNIYCSKKKYHGDSTVLAYKQILQWGFHLHPILKTRYWCTMSWLDGNKQWLEGDFLVYYYEKDIPYLDCFLAYWSVRWDGIYSKAEKNETYTLRYGWTKRAEKVINEDK